MPENPIFLLGLSTLFSAIPIAVWLYIFAKNDPKGRKALFLVFALGCLTAPILLGIQILWSKYPNFNLQEILETSINAPMLTAAAILLLFATMEETIKLYVIRAVDKKTLFITRINDAMRFAIAAALGFSFAENIYYLYTFWELISTGQLVGMYIFRSIFTTSAHILYTGVAGYFYGIGKFAIVINQQKEILGQHDRTSKIIAKIFRLPLSEGFRQKVVMKGYLFAIAMHFSVNYLLDLQQIIPVIIINVLGYFFLQHLLKRKAGHLILLNDPTTKKPSTIASKDEEVVVELLGMWFKEKKYVDVMHVCERLLERDPDNNVVQLFKAKAMDAMDEHDTYRKILGTVIKSKDDLSVNQQNQISKYIEEKENFQKVKAIIKEQLKKEGREFQEMPAAPILPPTPPTEVKAEEETFKL